MTEDKLVFIRGRIPEQRRDRFKALCALNRVTMEDVVSTLIDGWIDKQDGISSQEKLEKFLAGLAEGKRPDDKDCLIAAQEMGVKEESIFKLRDTIFKNQ
jgi:hypothetical protein